MQNLDPTHLLALHALLEERHVTRAARRVGITQSSMSHRLALLRAAFEDPLLVRSGAVLLLTPRAQSIAGPLSEALRLLQQAVSGAERFDPTTSSLTVSIVMPDLLAALVPRVVANLTSAGSGVNVRMSHVIPFLPEALGKGEPLLALVPTAHVTGPIMAHALGEVHFGVVGRHGHPALRGKLTTSKWLASGHVVVRLRNEQTNLIQSELQRRGLQRRVALEVPSFLAGLFAVEGSDLLMNAPLPLVEEAAAKLKLSVCDAPIALPRVRISLCWHQRFHRDAAHRWAREKVLDAVRPVFRR